MRALFLRGDRTAGGGSGFAALVVAIAIVACDAPIADTATTDAEAGAKRWELGHAIDEALRRIESKAALEWWNASQVPAPSLTRARVAAEAFRAWFADAFPADLGPARVTIVGLTVWIGAEPPESLPGELSIRARGTAHAQVVGEGSLQRDFETGTADPFFGTTAQFLEALAAEQAADPRSVVSQAVRSRLSRLFARDADASAASVSLEVDSALRGAAARLEADLRLGPPPEAASPPVPHDGAPEFPVDLHALVASLADGDFRDALRAWIDGRPFGPARALLRSLSESAAATLRAAAMDLLAADPEPLRQLLRSLPGVNETLYDMARAELAHFIDHLAAGARSAARAAQVFLDTLMRIDATPDTPASVHFVTLRVSNVVVEWRGGAAPVVASGEVVRPFEAVAIVTFDLHFTFAVPSAGAGGLAHSTSAPASVQVPVVAARPIGRAFHAVRSAATAAIAQAFPPLDAFADALALLEDARREVDRRLYALRERVAHKVEESSAAGFSRLVFRILDGIVDGNKSFWHRALFDFLERYFADALRDALTVNFTIAGINFSLVPDPIHQQVSLEHREGPHTFGVRLRRVTDKDDPFEGKWEDHLSLALEFYWFYNRPPLQASIVIDPLLRTDEGLLRFNLKSLEGEGLAFSLVAPRIVRREGVFEVALSNVLPGGVPVAATPTGGLVTLDVGARVEVAAVRLPTLAKWILRAVEEAWFDVVANRTVGELVDEVGAPQTAALLLEHFVQRLADTAAEQASRIIARIDLFARVADLEAAGTVVPRAEFSLAILEPVIVFREMASTWARFFRDAVQGTTLSRPAAAGILDWVPSAVHERVGLGVAFSVHGGLDAFLLGPSPKLPAVDLTLSLFFSAGALSTVLGRTGVHTVFEMALRLEGMPPAARKALKFWRLGPADALDLVWLRAESLSGPKILISEVLPSPVGNDPDLEFVELYNPGYAEEVLTGWSLRDGGGRVWRLPDGTRIGPGGTVLLARSSVPFLRAYGVAPEVPTLTLSLNDGGDRIELVNRAGVTSDEVVWGPFAQLTRAPPAGVALAREAAARPPLALPGSALLYTGSEFDFQRGAPTPGALPER